MPSRKTKARRAAAKAARVTGSTVQPPEDVREALSRVPRDQWLTTRNIQDIMGVHEVTVYRWVAAGHLRVHRAPVLGRQSLYERAEVIKFLKGYFLPRPVEDGPGD